MHRRYNLAHLILAGVVALGLTSLMVVVDAKARIAFVSERDGNREIYVMDDDGDICETSLTIPLMIGIPHGLLTVSALPSCLRGMVTLKSM